MRDIGVTGVQTCALPISLSTTSGVRPSIGAARTWPLVAAAAPNSAAAASTNGVVSAIARCSALARDRKSVVLGKSVDLGGRRVIKKHIIYRLSGQPLQTL